MEINPGVSFYNNMLDISDTDIKLAGNMSDAQQAFNACSMKFCHHFFRGKIFKCGPMTTLPMFMEQYRVTLTEEQEELLNAYRPASPDWDEDRLDAFFQNLNGKKPIDQCALCRERFERKPDFEASTQKIPLLNFKL